MASPTLERLQGLLDTLLQADQLLVRLQRRQHQGPTGARVRRDRLVLLDAHDARAHDEVHVVQENDLLPRVQLT